MENNWQFLTMSNIPLIDCSTIPLLGIHLSWNESLYLHKTLWVNVYSSPIQNQTGNKIRLFYRTHEQTMVHPHDGILLSNAKEWLMNTITRMNLKSVMLSERKQTQKAMCYMSPCIWYSGKAKRVGKETRSLVPGAKGRCDYRERLSSVF